MQPEPSLPASTARQLENACQLYEAFGGDPLVFTAMLFALVNEQSGDDVVNLILGLVGLIEMSLMWDMPKDSAPEALRTAVIAQRWSIVRDRLLTAAHRDVVPDDDPAAPWNQG